MIIRRGLRGGQGHWRQEGGVRAVWVTSGGAGGGDEARRLLGQLDEP